MAAIMRSLSSCLDETRMWRKTERASLEKKPSTRLSQEPWVGVKVNSKVRGLLRDPGSGLFGDVRGMIVEDQLDRGVGRIGGVEKLEEFDEFAAAVAYAQCRSNKGAPGVDGQDFADIEGYGGQRWLGELALALRQETYRPDPIRIASIPKANGNLRPLGISTLRDRACMTAAMLVLEPIL